MLLLKCLCLATPCVGVVNETRHPTNDLYRRRLLSDGSSMDDDDNYDESKSIERRFTKCVVICIKSVHVDSNCDCLKFVIRVTDMFVIQ